MSPQPQFIIDDAPTVAWPVIVRMPADGGHAYWQFTGTFRVYAEEDYERLIPSTPKDTEGQPIERRRLEVLEENAQALPSFLVGWEGVTDRAGHALPIAELPRLIRASPYGLPLSAGLWKAVMEIRSGLPPAIPPELAASAATPAAPEEVTALGNSAPPPAAGSSSAAGPAAPTN
jgi:hypothetical protein